MGVHESSRSSSLHKLMIVSAAAALAGGGICSTAHATDASLRGAAAASWTKGAVAGPSAVGFIDDEVSLAGDEVFTLPSYMHTKAVKTDTAALTRSEAGLTAFNALQQSKFKASFDVSNGRAKLLYGSLSKKYALAAEGVAHAFLKDAHDLLGIQQNLSDLKIVRVDETTEKNHVRFQQTFNGVPIVGATVIVHASKSGQVSMVQNGYVSGVQPVNADVIGEAAAKGIAVDNLKSSLASGATFSDAKIEKQIVLLSGKYNYIWKVSVPTKQPIGYWVYYVDTENGKVLYKKNEIVSLTSSKGLAFKSNADYLANKASIVPLKNLFTSSDISNGQYPGGFLYGISSLIYDCGDGSGSCYTVQNNQSTNNFVFDPITQKDSFHATQAYYAIDTTREWWKKQVVAKYDKYNSLLTPGSNTPFNWPTPVFINNNVDPDAACNAFYSPNLYGNGPGITFGNEDGCGYGSVDMVMDWDVVRHEYTHAMMDWAGYSDGAVFGTGQFGGFWSGYGRAMGEGNADWFGYLQHPKDPQMAKVDFGWLPGGYLRNLDNNRVYPYDVDYPAWGTAEEHYAGEIWGGYLYDLYRVLGNTNALKYVYQSFYYFQDAPNGGHMTGWPDFYDAIWAQIIAEYDTTNKLTNTLKAWGTMASRGLNACIRPPYSSTDYFNSGSPGQDNSVCFGMSFPNLKTVTTKANLLSTNDMHEYPVLVNNDGAKMMVSVVSTTTGIINPIIGLFDGAGNLLNSVSSENGKSVTMTIPSLLSGGYIIAVTGQSSSPARGYYNMKVSIQ